MSALTIKNVRAHEYNPPIAVLHAWLNPTRNDQLKTGGAPPPVKLRLYWEALHPSANCNAQVLLLSYTLYPESRPKAGIKKSSNVLNQG